MSFSRPVQWYPIMQIHSVPLCNIFFSQTVLPIIRGLEEFFCNEKKLKTQIKKSETYSGRCM